MATHAPEENAEQTQPVLYWSIATRIVFRFFFVYLGLFVIYFCPVWLQYLLFLNHRSRLVLGGVWPMHQFVFWAGVHIFKIAGPLTPGPGFDGIYYWIEASCLLVIATLATGIWSTLDRQRENYVTLHKWFRLVVRFVVAALMLDYGLRKVIPAQMPFPNLFELVQPFGHFDRFEVLWSSMGVATAYEIFAGCAETLGGILLIFPRTTALGALICLADLTNVFMLNVSYGVLNKLQILDVILLSLFLLAPEFPRLANIFVWNGADQLSTQPQLFRARRANGVALAMQIILGIYLIGGTVYSVWTTAWNVYGGGVPKPVLYGIWDVDQLLLDGQVRAPLLTDNDRWRRVIIDSGLVLHHSLGIAEHGAVAFERPDDSFAYYFASISDHDKTLTLTNSDDKNWSARFTFERPAPNQLILDGEMDRHKLHMQLHLYDTKKFELLNEHFHWIQ